MKQVVREKPLLDFPRFVRGADKPNDFSVGAAKFCVGIGEMVVCPGDCKACPLICEKNPPVMYTRCRRCNWRAFGQLDALIIAESVHRGTHEERIRRRAYELYEQRRREDGHDMEDWLRAEAEEAASLLVWRLEESGTLGTVA